jgi:pimeloyl-ACP methyl ester carboxylesterase
MQKRSVTLGSETIAYARAGSGAPVIVLLNGAGGPLDAWRWIWEGLAQQTTVLAYNRPGIGGSSKPNVAQTSDVVISTLRALLQHLEIAPPYLLVGHSLGGLHANFFARRHPEEVAAIVYLDAAAPGDIALMQSLKGPIVRSVERAIEFILPQDQRAEAVHATHSAALIGDAGAFPPIPVTVITGARGANMPKLARDGRARHQAALAAASPLGKQIIAEHSGHFPQITEPRLVGAAIADTLASTRRAA